MNFKKIVDNFIWKPETEYQFSLPTSGKVDNTYVPLKDLNLPKNVLTNLSANIDFVKMKYNSLINSDIILREFVINVHNKQYEALLLFIDGLVDSDLINNYILKPLMLKNKSNCSTEAEASAKTLNSQSTNLKKVKVKKKEQPFDIVEYISNCLLPQNTVNIEQSFEKLFSGVNSGNCVLFIDTLDFAFDIEVKGFKQRSIGSPNTEVVIKGPQEAFVENIRINTSLLRRIINSEDLILENIDIGSITKTKCAICYMKNITNNDLIAEVRYRLNNLEIDSLLSSGQL